MPIKCDASSAITSLLLLASVISVALGAFSWARTTTLFLPLPAWIPALATLVPPITIVALASSRILYGPLFDSSTHQIQHLELLNYAHTIVLSVTATVALAYLYPDPVLSCYLDQQWQTFYRKKNSHAIRVIQDTFRCCGLRSTHDRAWPFKDRNHGDNACELQLGYRRSCLSPWREVQMETSWMVVAAVMFVLVVKITFEQLSGRRTSWMNTRVLQSGRETPRISGPELEEGDGDEAGGERTLLPRSRPGNENMWDTA
ncbi:uncharacterized protein BJX67DRAFT_246288 [Aspergillus lucknowensis]|uniref:Tetraspanin Tsp3 n=1 Tax=Aspergillus lucknowensis TaxID=176173 RepID=A0ABR4M1P8_9EURO